MYMLHSRFAHLAALGAVTVLLGGCTLLTNTAGVNDANTNTGDDAMMEKKSVTVTLNAQNNSNQQGSATLSDEDGKTKVTIATTGAPSGVSQPAHIHVNSCATIGGVKYPLTNVVAGASETMLDVSLDDILAAGPLSLNIHKSAAEASVYVACGDITDGSTMMPAEGESVSDGEEAGDGSMMEDKKDDGAMMQGGTKEFTVEAMNFSFSVKELRVKKGDKVKITFVNKEGFHDWVLGEFNVKTPQIQGGQTATVEFTADKTGTFEYYCSVGQHRAMGMVGKLIVE